MAIASDVRLRELLTRPHGLRIDGPLEDHQFQPCSIDLTLGNELLIFDTVGGLYLTLDSSPDMERVPFTRYLLKPNEFLLGATEQSITMPNYYAARVEGKSSLGRLGLMVHVTAGLIDPGFHGHITLELHNVNNIPIEIKHGMSIAQLCLETLDGHVSRPYGSKGLNSHYQDSVGTQPMKASNG